MNSKTKSDFCIEIDFDRNLPNPERVFNAMAGLISSLKETDKILINSISSKIEPVMMLENIESGSIKTWLRQVLIETDDDALKNVDWKKQIGKYLVKGKYILLDFLDGKTTITDRKEIEGLQNNLTQLAEDTGVNEFPIYVKPNAVKLLKNMSEISDSVKVLGKTDTAKYISSEGNATFNLEMNFSPEGIESLITKESIENTVNTILKVKKPDYLGDSMWTLKYNGRSIEAKILDDNFLLSFQNREEDIRPGDSLRAELRITANYGYDNSHLDSKYDVIKVISIERTDTFDTHLSL